MFSEIPYPEGISFLGRSGLSSFSLMLMAAFISALYIVKHDLKRRKLRVEIADGILLWAVIGSIVGSKIFFVFEIWSRIWVIDIGFWDTLYRVFFTWNGMQHAGGESLWGNLFSGSGLVFYGGFAFACLSLYLYLRFSKVSIWQYADSAVLGLAIGYAIGRLGCFVSGDGCFGHAAGVHIPLFTWVYGPESGNCPNDPALGWKYPYLCTDGVAVWNTPLMESLVSLSLLAWFLLRGRYQNFRPGMLLATFMIVNGLARFLVEFIRLNDAVIAILAPPAISIDGSEVSLPHHVAEGLASTPNRDYFTHWHWYGFTQSQLFALVLILIAIVWIWRGKLYRKDGYDATGRKS